jgi:hypothetical protein
MEKEFENLEQYEGMKVKWSNGNDSDGVPYTFDAIVVGFEYDIGLSIIDEHDPTHELTCMHGPSWKGNSNYNLEAYDDEINVAIEMIKGGYYDVQKTPHSNYGCGNNLICAFKA